MIEETKPGHSDYLAGYARALVSSKEVIRSYQALSILPETKRLFDQALEELDDMQLKADEVADTLFIEIDWVNPPKDRPL